MFKFYFEFELEIKMIYVLLSFELNGKPKTRKLKCLYLLTKVSIRVAIVPQFLLVQYEVNAFHLQHQCRSFLHIQLFLQRLNYSLFDAPVQRIIYF